MPKLQFVDFKAVKAAMRMEQVLEHYALFDKFKRSGDSLSGPCPIHKGSNPTQFRVSLSKNVWNCFSECKHGGNTLDFIARMENISIHAAAQKAIEWFHLDTDAMSADSKQDAPQPQEVPKSESAPRPGPASEAAAASDNDAPNKPLKFRLDKLQSDHPYLAERGLTPETIAAFGIGFCSKGMMAERIALPIYNAAGLIVAYAGRFPGEPPEGTPKYKLPQGFRKSLELFNIDRAIKEPPEKALVIVEGFFGCMNLYQHGCRRVVALMGSTMSAAQEELIRKHTNGQGQVIVMLDEDAAGRAGREDIAVRLARFLFVKVHTFEQEGRQPEQLAPDLRHHGARLYLFRQFLYASFKESSYYPPPQPQLGYAKPAFTSLPIFSSQADRERAAEKKADDLIARLSRDGMGTCNDGLDFFETREAIKKWREARMVQQRKSARNCRTLKNYRKKLLELLLTRVYALRNQESAISLAKAPKKVRLVRKKV